MEVKAMRLTTSRKNFRVEEAGLGMASNCISTLSG